uniref:Uncharacterized protein n=1 Tax=Triticum urartu TaxID=4572 RepID=A0A8R7V2G6_TRIUA
WPVRDTPGKQLGCLQEKHTMPDHSYTNGKLVRSSLLKQAYHWPVQSALHHAGFALILLKAAV